MPGNTGDKALAQIRRAFSFQYDTWKVLSYGLTTGGDLVALQVDADGVLATSGSGGGGSLSGFTDHSQFSPTLSEGQPAYGFYTSSASSVDDGDAGILAMTEYRALHVNLRDAFGDAYGTTTNPVFITGAVEANSAESTYISGTTPGAAVWGGLRNDTKTDVVGADFRLGPLSMDSDGGLIRMAEIQTAVELIDDAVVEDFETTPPDKALAVGGFTRENTTTSGRVPVVFKADRAGRQIVVSQSEVDRPYIADGGFDTDEFVWSCDLAAGGSPASGEFEPDSSDGWAVTEIILHDTDLAPGASMNGLLDQLQAGDEILVRSSSALESLTSRHIAYRVTGVSFSASRYTISVEAFAGARPVFTAAGQYQFTFLLASRRGTMLRKSDGTELGTSTDPVFVEDGSNATVGGDILSQLQTHSTIYDNILTGVQTNASIYEQLVSGTASVVDLATATGFVNATNLSSDDDWTDLTDVGITVHAYEIENHCDAPIEVCFNDSPNPSSGIDIDTYVMPRSSKIVDLYANGLRSASDIKVRRATTTPVAGWISGTAYGE